MNCPYCGMPVNENQSFCPKCGNRIINHTITNDYEISDTKELEIFIDRNVKKILSRQFSFPTFFLGILYCLYRKMYLLALLFIGISIPFSIAIFIIGQEYTTIFIIFYLVIYMVFNLLISIKFNSLYINHANAKINKIKKKNPNLSNFEISEKIKYSGGTNLLIPVIYIALVMFSNILLFNYQFKNHNDQLSNNNFIVTTALKDSKASLYLNSDASFIWYIDASDKSDNYYVGSYEVFNGSRAIIKSKDYDIDTERLNDKDNYYLLVLTVERIASNNNVESTNYQLIYYGIYDKNNDSIDLNSVNSNDYFKLKKVKEISL